MKKINVNSNALVNKQLKATFIIHLNRVYCAKSHLIERLPEIADQAVFSDLKFAITETWDDVVKQILRMDKIYVLMNSIVSFQNCDDMINTVEGAYAAIHLQHENTISRDLSILFYMTNIETLELASFTLLQKLAVKLKYAEIAQLLKENFDEAKDDRALMQLISAKYLTN